MPSTQHLRLQERIRQESALILRLLKDPRIGFASVVRAEVSQEGQFARIHVSVLGGAEQERSTLRALNHARGFFRTRLGEALGIRKVPEIAFAIDRSAQEAQRVDQILHEIDPGGTQ